MLDILYSKKGELAIRQLLGWVLVLATLVVLLWLAGNWILSAGDINIF